MKLRDALLVPMLLTAGIAIPFYVGAQSANESAAATASDEALAEQVELLITQLGSDTPALRERAEKQLEATGQAALPFLKQALENATKGGEADMAARLKTLIERVNAQDGAGKAGAGQFKSGDSSRAVWRIEPSAGAAKTMVWVENGKTTSVSQSADGKITLKLTENGTESVESFDNLEAFKEKHADYAKRFENSGAFNSTFRVFNDLDQDDGATDPFDAARRALEGNLFREIPQLDGLFGRAGSARALDADALRAQLKELDTHLNRAAAQNAELAKLLPEGASAEDIAKNLDAIRKTIEDNRRNIESATKAAAELGKQAEGRIDLNRARLAREQAEQEFKAAQERARSAEGAFRKAVEDERRAAAESSRAGSENRSEGRSERVESPMERMNREMQEWQRDMQERMQKQLEEWRRGAPQPRSEAPGKAEPEKKPAPDKTESDW